VFSARAKLSFLLARYIAKEPSVSAKEPSVSATYIAKETYVFAKEPCLCAKEPYEVAQTNRMPYLYRSFSAKEPFN